MKIVHFADLHLDAQFAWAGAGNDAARRRRQGLRDALARIADLVRETRADALFCGGDLYENERVAPDTAEFLRMTFAELDPIRVFLAPGNHDWYGPQSLYALVEWSRNVHVFTEPELKSVQLSPEITLWGSAHCAPANTPNLLQDFTVSGPGIHIALFHGSERSWLAAQGDDKQPHAPFEASQIESAGLDHAFLGHYHRPRDASRQYLPGQPRTPRFRRGRRTWRRHRHNQCGRHGPSQTSSHRRWTCPRPGSRHHRLHTREQIRNGSTRKQTVFPVWSG